MQLETGAVLEGKVTGITKFGAFVGLAGDKSGLVHISEIANSYVSDINEHLKVGQTVKVKVLGINDGKINLSIKKAQETQPAPQPRKSAPQRGNAQADGGDNFEDKLKKFMQESDSRIAGNPMYADRGKSRRRR